MKFSTSIPIDKPATEVFRYVVLQPQNMKHWVQGFEAFRPQSGSKRKEGSVAAQVFHDGDHKTEVREEVLEVRPHKRFRCLLTHRNMQSEQDYHFLDQGGGQTKLYLATEVKLRPALFNLFGFLVKGPMRKQQAADLERLKSELEAG
jgi:hypothetical protein